MPIRLYDTASRKTIPFEPDRVVSMYVCGITPYDSTHLGHAATVLMGTYDNALRESLIERRDIDQDLLRRTLPALLLSVVEPVRSE